MFSHPSNVPTSSSSAPLPNAHTHNAHTLYRQYIRPLPKAVHGSAVHGIGTKLYVLGGAEMPAPASVDYCQVYDTESGQWEATVRKMPCGPRFGFASASIVRC